MLAGAACSILVGCMSRISDDGCDRERVETDDSSGEDRLFVSIGRSSSRGGSMGDCWAIGSEVSKVGSVGDMGFSSSLIGESDGLGKSGDLVSMMSIERVGVVRKLGERGEEAAELDTEPDVVVEGGTS